MVDPFHELTQPIQAPSASRPQAAAGEASGGPAFRALLDQLEQRAREVRAASESLERPEELSGALDSARASLADALSLQERLLEAFQQARRQGGGA